MTIMGSNERSHAIDLISNINEILSRYDLSIKKAGGEKTIFNKDIEADRRVMFPDILLYSDEDQNEIIQGWEIKLTDTNINDEGFINDAQYKADVLGLNSTILWNFNSVALYIKDTEENWKLYKSWNELNFIKKRTDVDINRDEWLDFLDKFLKELNGFFIEGSIKPRDLSKITDNLISHIVNDNKALVANYLKDKNKENRLVSSKINNWWHDAKNEFLGEEKNPYDAYAKVILLGWVLRFTFAHVIKLTHNEARRVNELSKDNTPEDANKLFEKITMKSDFYTIFEEKEYDTYLPLTTWYQVIEFNKFLEDKVISHEMLQDLLETTVNRSKRELVGQFTTPMKLASLLVRLTLLNSKGHTLDPCAGTGTISKEVFKLKKDVGLSLDVIHDTTWASDKLQVALQIANMSLTTPDSMNKINKVFKENALNLYSGNDIKFRSPTDGEFIEEKIPRFSNIVSNLPFIQFESIDKYEKDYIEKIREDIFKRYNIKLDKRADYFVYVFYSLTNILEEGGRVGLVTSNSWLGTKWGRQFYKLLVNMFDIEAIIGSGKGRWFKNADIVTTLLILNEKKSINHQVKFIEILENLEELSFKEINSLSDSIMADGENKYYSVMKLSYDEIEWCINNGISMRTLLYDINWMKKVKSHLKPLSNFFNVQRGVRRGWNAMFHLPKNHNIEQNYVYPFLKSSKDINHLLTEPQSSMLAVSISLEELEEYGHIGALTWIRKFENATNNIGRPLREVLSTKQLEWYQLKTDGLLAEFVTSMNPNKRLFWAMLKEPTFIDQRLIGISRNDEGLKYDKTLLLALLNSILGLFFIESSGFGRGLGALDLNKGTVSQTLILDPSTLSNCEKRNIIRLFNKIDKTLEQDTLSSLENKERIEMDFYILKCYGLEHEYDYIKFTLTKLLLSRTSVNS